MFRFLCTSLLRLTLLRITCSYFGVLSVYFLVLFGCQCLVVQWTAWKVMPWNVSSWTDRQHGQMLRFHPSKHHQRPCPLTTVVLWVQTKIHEICRMAQKFTNPKSNTAWTAQVNTNKPHQPVHSQLTLPVTALTPLYTLGLHGRMIDWLIE